MIMTALASVEQQNFLVQIVNYEAQKMKLYSTEYQLIRLGLDWVKLKGPSSNLHKISLDNIPTGL